MRHRILASPTCAALAGGCRIGRPGRRDRPAAELADQREDRAGEFTQKQLKGQGGEGKAGGTSSGTLAFSRPGKFTWRYTKPYEQLLQADGQTLFIYDKDLNQVTERKLDNALAPSPAAILFGSNDLTKNFDVKNGATRDGVEWPELTPKSKDTQFEKIQIGFGRQPEAMELRDASAIPRC